VDRGVVALVGVGDVLVLTHERIVRIAGAVTRDGEPVNVRTRRVSRDARRIARCPAERVGLLTPRVDPRGAPFFLLSEGETP
jgi:hypothetical protein